MLVSFGAMTTAAFPKADTVSSATPLVDIANGNDPAIIDLLLGKHGGAIGEVCAIALIIGGIYLLARKVITWHIPVAFIGFTFVFSFLFGGFDVMFSLEQILAGGLFIGAIFMATDYVTSPSSSWGKVIFAVGAAFLTVAIRLWANYPEGVSFAILLMNILNPYIESIPSRKLFGGKKA
jgi:electron transport complex protein RnfD